MPGAFPTPTWIACPNRIPPRCSGYAERATLPGPTMLTTEILRSVPLLSGLSDSEIELVAKSSRRVQYPKRSIVFQEGDPGDFLLVILSGRVKVMLVGESGQETTIAILERPGFLGEVAL